MIQGEVSTPRQLSCTGGLPEKESLGQRLAIEGRVGEPSICLYPFMSKGRFRSAPACDPCSLSGSSRRTESRFRSDVNVCLQESGR